MVRKTRKNNDEITHEFYGINSTTFAVESVSLTRGGTLSKMTLDGYRSHIIPAGRYPRSEIMLVFGLVELVEVNLQFEIDEQKKRLVDDLPRKAAAMKAEKAAREAQEIPREKSADKGDE
jgi:hypothetical protein